MFKTIKNSLAFRLPNFYQPFLRAFKPVYKPSSNRDNINLVILTGLAQIPMLTEVLATVFAKFSLNPIVHLYLDKNVSEKLVLKKLSRIPKENLEITTAENCIAYHLSKGQTKIAEFAKRNPMGLKMAAILQAADREKPLIYCDTDVLWHQDPCQELKELIENESVIMALSYDFQPAYDENMIDKGNLEILKTSPFYCAGILLLKSFSNHNKQLLGGLLDIAIEQSNHFTEQTLFSYFNKINGNVGLPKEKFAIILDDQFQILPIKNQQVIARHYIGPVRHHFWRDAFFNRLWK